MKANQELGLATRSNISFQSTPLKKSYLKVRAKGLGLGYSQLARAVVNRWLLEGAPAIDEIEKSKGIPPISRELHEELKATNLYHP